ncbi:LOW QUALITY PROTEIN: ABC transporter [Phytophthora megakarya]|uniref:ABC transporter n=1 Tax=Phytophthora megakarya TaxID=4795 RepID=A0A225WAL3_9STRA|nr:LOW QUALITY PROTEIN: ABC transporter [Phytophthora megakarya]
MSDAGSANRERQPWTKQLKHQTSYVAQDDQFYETITVREHLNEKRVDEVMEELGLVKCRDTLIGGTSLRGISDGERKRLSYHHGWIVSLHLASWYVARNLSDLPMQLLLPFVAFFLIEIGHGFKVFISLQIITMLFLCGSSTIGSSVELMSPRSWECSSCYQCCCSVDLVNSDDTPVYFIWINYISPIKLSFDAMMKIFWMKCPKFHATRRQKTVLHVQVGKSSRITVFLHGQRCWMGYS